MILAPSTTRSVVTNRAGISAWSRANRSRVITAPSTPDHWRLRPRPFRGDAILYRARRELDAQVAQPGDRGRALLRDRDVAAVDDEAAVGGGHQDGAQAAVEPAQISQVRRVRDDEGIDAQTGQGLPHGVEAREVWRIGSNGRAGTIRTAAGRAAFAARMAARKASSAGSAASSG